MNKTTAHPRHLARSMARAEFEAAGVTGFNKEGHRRDGQKTPSRFSASWRKLAAEIAARPPKHLKKKGARKK